MPEEFASTGVAERIWRDFGCPTGVRALIDVLEKVLTECRQNGIRYAPILLQRKKALGRGTWQPLPEQVANLTDASEVGRAEGYVCSRCGGLGYMAVRGGMGATLCPCDAWKKQLVRPA